MTTVTLKTLKVAPFVGGLAKRFAPYGLRFGNFLRVNPGSGSVVEPRIHTSAQMLQRILEDLIHAAFSRSPESAELTIRSESAALEFRVADSGSSVALEQRAQMISDDLAYTKRAVEALGGALWMESNAPRGAVVCFVLPMGN
jgi:signal transduction histidine kinase